MQIIKTIIMVLCIIPGGAAVCCYLKVRRLLNENNDDEWDNVLPEFQLLTRKLSVMMGVLVAAFVLYLVMLIVEFALGIL